MEAIQTLNYRLKRDFGRFENGEPNWRVVWSEDQFEKRWTNFTDEGFELLSPVVKELPKYKQWIHNKYILERLIPVPDLVESDLIGKISYEPVWVFQDSDGNPLPPKWEAILLIIDSVNNASASSIGAKYKDPELTVEGSKEEREKRLDAIQADLFGNETEVGDALAQKQAIIVPRSYES
jgi:hypothetical protein